MSGHNRWSKIKHTKAASGTPRSPRAGRSCSERSPSLPRAVVIPAAIRGCARRWTRRAPATSPTKSTIKRAIQKGTGRARRRQLRRSPLRGLRTRRRHRRRRRDPDRQSRNRTAPARSARCSSVAIALKLAAAGSRCCICFTRRVTSCSSRRSGRKTSSWRLALEAAAPTTCAPTARVSSSRPRRARSSRCKEEAGEAGVQARCMPRSACTPRRYVQARGGGRRGDGQAGRHTLEDHDDVQNVYANYDIDDALMEQLSAAKSRGNCGSWASIRGRDTSGTA